MRIHKLFMLAVVALSLLATGVSVASSSAVASPTESIAGAVDTAKPIYRHCFGGLTSGCLEIYTDTLGAIRYRELTDTRVVTLDQPATSAQEGVYADFLLQEEQAAADLSLSGDIEPGKRIVQWLRDYADEQAAAAAAWDGMTTAQQLSMMKQKLGKDAKLVDGLADLLVTLGR